MNHYPHHIGDFMRDTAGLSMLEECAYRRLLDQYYSRELPLPLDRGEVYRLARAATRQEKQAVDYVVGRFFFQSEDGWHQKRADRELAAQHERSESARKSAAARWQSANPSGMRTHSDGNANASETHSDGNASQEPVASSHKPEDQKRKAESRPRKRGSPLPDAWELPDDWLRWAMAERPAWSTAEALRVSLIFRDHWHGTGESRANWAATWQNWVRRERGEAKREKSLAEKRAENMADLTGQRGKNGSERVIDITSVRVDRADFPALPNALREPGGDHVGGYSESGTDRDVA